MTIVQVSSSSPAATDAAQAPRTQVADRRAQTQSFLEEYGWAFCGALALNAMSLRVPLHETRLSTPFGRV